MPRPIFKETQGTKLVYGHDETDPQALSVDEDGHLQVDMLTGMLTDSRMEVLAFPDDTTWTYPIDALNDVNTAETDGMATLGIGISGTWDGTLSFETTMNGTDYYTIPCFDLATGTLVGSTTINGIFIVSCAGLYRVRVRGSVWNSGAASVRLRASIMPYTQLREI